MVVSVRQENRDLHGCELVTLDPRNLVCHICGKIYHVDNYDPDSPSAYMCLECFKKELEEAK